MIPNINYNEKGQRSDIHYGNGCKTRYEYDKNTFRLIRLLATRNTGRDILQDIHYTYDPVGNIVEIVDNAQQNHYFSNSVIEPRAMYKYDALYRLIEATGREKSGLANAFSNADMGIDFPIPHNGANSMENYTHFYAYDKLGNIMSMNSQGKWLRNYVYAPGSNLLLKHDSQQTIDDYAYDEHGNITRMPGLEDMQWNYADYLSKTQCGTVNTWYVYDQSGNRSRKITEKQGGIREERIYLGSYELYRKYQGAELEIERSTVHIMDDKSRVAIVDRQTVENGNTVSGTVNYRYQLSNHLGSATLELDQTAQIISYEEYHPFGTTSYWSGQSESEVKKKRYRYVGKERDEETGLYYYGARYYAAWIGRFVSVDPLKHKRVDWTPYNAMRCNPINNVDPTGALDTDFLNKETGQTQHVEDRKDQVVMVNNKDYQKISELNSPTKTQWNKSESEFYFNTIKKGEKLDWESDLGKITRVVYGEMSGIGTTSNADRQVVAESIVNRKESGLYGQTYSDILTPKQYNAISTTTYKDGPYSYMNNLKENQPYFYNAHESEIRENFLNSLSVSYKAMNRLDTEIGNGVVSYVSPPLKSTHFDKDPYLKNITSTIIGLKGISGAWKRK